MKEIDFDNIEQHKEAFSEGEVAFCCLGTTRAKSGADGFVKVDYDYVVNTAKILKDNGICKDYHLISSKGKQQDRKIVNNFSFEDLIQGGVK